MKNLNEELKHSKKGITLISLVVTIIVLLILAGITIAALSGDNGILTNATKAKEQTDIEKEKEQILIAAQAALMDNNGIEILQNDLEKELEKSFEKNKYNVEEGKNAEKYGYIVTMTDTGRRYFIDKSGTMEQIISGPMITHTINPETQINEGEKITITISAIATEGKITKITKPDGTTVENVTETTYEVEENGKYTFIVEQSNGGNATYVVEITNGKYVEKFSDIYTETEPYTKNGLTAWIPKGFAVGISSTIDEISKGLVITDEIDENHNSIGNEFVWIPVDGILGENGKTVQNALDGEVVLGRYVFKEDGTIDTDLTPTTQGEEITINGASYVEGLEGKGNTIAKDIESFIDSVRKKGGYYIARFEASKGTNNKAESKYNKAVWNEITQQNSAMACQDLYTEMNSDLINSYAWDTAILFIQKYGQIDYSRQTSLNSSKQNTGISGDKQLNIYDMASNVGEYCTETSLDNLGPCEGRGGDYQLEYNYTSNRGGNSLSYKDVRYGFRAIIYE